MPTRKPKAKSRKRKEPQSERPWRGPYVDGITQSLLNRWLFCRHRFFIYAILGLEEERVFFHSQEFGNLWHLCEEHHAANKDWKKPLRARYQELLLLFPGNTAEITKWYTLTLKMFEQYVIYWKTHDDTKGRTPLYQEEKMRETYTLPSGRQIVLNGMIDAADWITNKNARTGKKHRGIYIQENKARGAERIDGVKLQNELPSTLQPMMYSLMMKLRGERTGEFDPAEVKGIRYNVIVRPLSRGCEYLMRQRKGRLVWNAAKTQKVRKGEESDIDFFNRVAKTFADDPEYYFRRWRVDLIPADYAKFNKEILNPLLESFCDWYDWVDQHADDPFVDGGGGVHWRTPFGVFNPFLEGFDGDYYEYLRSGSTQGLNRVETLFPELQDT